MKNALMPLFDGVLLSKRPVIPMIETVNDPLKTLRQIEHFRHRSSFNCLFNWLLGRIAYAYHPDQSFVVL